MRRWQAAGWWRRLCELIDDGLNPVTARDLGVLSRKRLVGSSLVLTHGCAVAGMTTELLVRERLSIDGLELGVVHVLAGILSLFVLPAQAGMALRERSENIELVLVAGISARRLALGKFLAVFLPGMITLISLGPYFLLNYFLGGGELLNDLRFLCVCVTGAAVMTAAAGAVGTLRYVSLLAGLVVGGAAAAIILQALLGDLDDGALKFFGWQLPAYLVFTVAPALWFFLTLHSARYARRDVLAEEAVAYGMMAAFLGLCGMVAGTAAIGAVAVLAVVVALILLSGVAAFVHSFATSP